MSVKQQGVATWSFPDAKIKEIDTFTCIHCNSIVYIKVGAPIEDLGGFCRMCMKPVCPNCADGACTPFERKMEQMERRDRLLRSVGI